MEIGLINHYYWYRLRAEIGAFEILRFQTFTTEIFTELNLGISTAGRPRTSA